MPHPVAIGGPLSHDLTLSNMNDASHDINSSQNVTDEWLFMYELTEAAWGWYDVHPLT